MTDTRQGQGDRGVKRATRRGYETTERLLTMVPRQDHATRQALCAGAHAEHRRRAFI